MMPRIVLSFLLWIPFSATVQAQRFFVADFESDSYGDWTVEGDAFGTQPAPGSLQGQMQGSGFEGRRLVNSFHNGDKTQGSLTFTEFDLSRDYLSFLIGGGNLPEKAGIELLVDGKQPRVATGSESETLRWKSWDVRKFKGRTAHDKHL